MAETPAVLPETPPDGRDLLSDMLSGMHLSGMVLFRAEFREPWLILAPAGCDLSRLLPIRAEASCPSTSSPLAGAGSA